MTSDTLYSGLPDPDTQEAFYRDVPTKRAVAWAIDVVITSLLTLIALPFTLFTALFYLPVLYMIIAFVYRAATIAGGSATLGMRLTGLQILNHKGERLDPLTAILHVSGYVASMTMVVPQIISVALMLTSARRQGLTDMVLSTAAVNRAARPFAGA